MVSGNPPTPAFAKAGSAPGTTGGVELGPRVASKGTRHQGNTSVSYMPQTSTCSCRTLTPTCPRTFKTAVCPASNPPNASAGLQGNNSYSYMPLPSVFQGVQDCRLARPQTPQTLPTLPQASKATTLTATCPQTLQTLPTLSQASKATTLTATCLCFSGGSRLPFARPQTPQTLPTLSQASKATTLTATCPTLPQASKATTLTATCPCHLFFRGFKTAVCPAPNPPNASNPPAGLQGNNSYSYMPLPSVFQGVQDCRLPALKPPKRFQRSRRPPRQQLLQLHVPAICFSGGSRLPSQAQLHAPAICFFRGFKTAVCPASNPPNASSPPAGLQGNNSYSYMPPPSVFEGVQDCRLPALKPAKRFQRPAGLQGNNSYSYMSLPSVFRGFKTAVASKSTRNVCPASNPPNASARLQGNNSYSYYMPLPSVFQGVQDCRLPALKPPKRFQRSRRPPRQQLLQLHAPAICFSGGSRLPSQAKAHAIKATPLSATCPAIYMLLPNSYTYMPLPPVFQDVQDYRLPGLKPSKRFRRPPRQQLTLTATCPCHLFFRGLKTAVCPPSNPPNASNPPAGLQGNNSYSMPLPSVFQGVQDCRLPALKPPKRFQRSRRPPRQQLLQLHVPAICFSGGSRLPFCSASNPPNASNPPAGLQGNNKATTLTATCPCHLFFRGFKTAVCPPSNPPNASNPPAGLQGNNSYSYMSLPSVFSGRSRLPFARPQNRPNASAGLQGNNSYSYMSLPSVFQGVQDCRLPGLKPPKPEPVIHHLLWGFCCGTNHFVFLAWFPSRRVMVDVNLPKRTA